MQLTIRTEDKELEEKLEEVSRQRRWSLNQTAIHVLRKGLDLQTEVAPEPIGDRLDAFFGVWDREEAAGFERATEEAFGQVDEENWK